MWFVLGFVIGGLFALVLAFDAFITELTGR